MPLCLNASHVVVLSTRENVPVYVEVAKDLAASGITLPWSGFIYVCCAGISKVDISRWVTCWAHSMGP